MTKSPLAFTATIAAGLMIVTGCASTGDRPVQQLTRAESSIEHAEQNGAREYSTVSLDQARDKLAQAQRAADRGETDQARRLAEQAELDAELAAAQASRGKADEALAEIDQSINTLREEIARNATQ